LRQKSARLALAQKRRCSPQRIAPDALLQQLALNDTLSPEALDSLFASHDIHDRAVTQSLLTIVQRELQSA
jgi:ribonuclease D